MNVSLYQAAAALNANARWQEIIAQNLATASVPGFKKQELSFSAVEAGLMPGSAVGGAQHVLMPQSTTVTNFQQGQLRMTGVNTDVALEGTGFFEVQLPNGDVGYTRDGEFHVNAQGQLVTKQGYVVQSDGGAIQVDLNNPAPLSVGSDGTVSQGADVKGKLKISDFENPRLLNPISNGYYLALNPNLITKPADTTTVRQGFLESANTSAVTEMAHLIAAMRQYEASQRVIQMQDERMSRAINELGNPNPV